MAPAIAASRSALLSLAVSLVLLGACSSAPPADRADARPGSPVCGDGVVAGDEACDDGNDVDGDACRRDCTWARCGDGVVRSGVEECDDDDPSCVSCLRCDDGDALTTTFAWSESGHCYAAVDGRVTQPEARLACADDGGNLLSMESHAEREAVVPALFDVDQADVGGAWIGLTRNLEVSGDPYALDAWSWERGGPLAYEYWNCCGRGGGEEPNNLEVEHCAELLYGHDDVISASLVGTWNNLPCDLERAFVCEREPWAVRDADAHGYRVVYARLSWSEAAAHCERHGAHLAAPTTADENEFVTGLLGRPAWIGAYASSFGDYAWRSGERFEFAAWDDGQPEEAAGCAVLAPDAIWRSEPCDGPRPFVCEHD